MGTSARWVRAANAKMVCMRHCLRALFLLLVCLGVWAQAPERSADLTEPRLEGVGDALAITDSVVVTLATDQQGFLWVGTAVGLVRHDGYSFRPFHPPADGDYPPTHFVRSLLVAHDGRLWVGTDSDGLAQFDPVSRRWTLYRPGHAGLTGGTVRTLAEGADAHIWAGTVGGGLQRLDPTTQRFTSYGVAQGLPDARIEALMVSRDGTLWVGTWNGVARLRPGAQRFEMAEGLMALGGRVVSLLREDALGRFWVGTQSGELLLVDGATQHQLSAGGEAEGATQAMADMGDETWIGRSNGIEIRRTADGQLLRLLQHSAARPWGLGGADVRAMVRDASGVLWVGSYGGGLQRHVPNGGAIRVRRGDGHDDSAMGVADVRSLAALRNGEIWAGTNSHGIAILDKDLRLRAEIRPERGVHRAGRVGGIAQARDDTVWAAGGPGVLRFDPSTRHKLNEYSVGRGRVRLIRAAGDGGVWVGTQDGLYRWRPGAAALERLARADGSPLQGDINALAEQADGRLWVGGEAGLFVVEPAGGHLLPVAQAAGADLGTSTVLGLLIDRRQQLWLDTVVGLRRLLDFNRGVARFERISERIGQAGQAFGANLMDDEQGRIWTHRGVYDPASGQFHGLSQADGVDIGTGWFRSYVALADGRLLFGGSRGIMVLQASRFQPWQYPPPVVATELWVNGRVQPLARLLPALALAPDERGFTLEFAALDLSQPSRNRHRFRLEGLDSDWTAVDPSQRVASYAGLEPGRYRLLVQGSNRNGDWSPQRLEIDIDVLPAWWQRWWARALLGLLLIGLVLGLVQARTRQLSHRQAELERRVQQRTEELEAVSATLREKSRELEDSALTDPLTGLRNRRFATERLDDDMHLMLRRYEEAHRHGLAPPDDADLCLFLIDIDHFKQVNDQHGHAAGDAVLVQMRERLLQVFREADYLVRWGGEEFLVVARGTARAAAPVLAERARQAVEGMPFRLTDDDRAARTMARSCSIGFACLPLRPSQPRAVGWTGALNLADAALYAAKREGRNRWVGVLDAGDLADDTLLQAVASGGELPAGLHLVRGPMPSPAAAN